MKILSTILFCTLASSLFAKEVQEIILQATSKEEEKVTKKESPLLIGTERIRFFDGSDLRGTLLKLDQENNIHCTTGSLGHGLPISVGMAMARKMQHKKGSPLLQGKGQSKTSGIRQRH
mgnify:CR=1 FL=1